MRSKARGVHPGEVLRAEYLEPLGMSANQLAHAIGVPTNRLTEMIAGRRTVTADTALRLSRALGTTAEFWMNLQQAYDLRVAERALGEALTTIKPLERKR